MSSENRFFEEVKGRLDNYTPEAPSEVFGMARNQFLTRRFFKFNVQHFNIWYAGVLVTGATVAILFSNPKSEPEVIVSTPKEVQTPQIVQPTLPEQTVEQKSEAPKEKAAEVKEKRIVVKPDASEPKSNEAHLEEEKTVPLEKSKEAEPEPKSKSLNVKVLKEKK
jgi:hypothetical protein